MTIKLSRAASPKACANPRKILTIPRSKPSARPKPARKAGLPNIGVLQAQPAGERAARRLIEWPNDDARPPVSLRANRRLSTLRIPFGFTQAFRQCRAGYRPQRRGKRLERSLPRRAALEDEPDQSRSAVADNLQAGDPGARTAPVDIGEKGREGRPLTGGGEMTQCLEARPADVGAKRRPLRRLAERPRLIAQTMTLSQQKKGARIDLLDADRDSPALFRVTGKDEEKRLVVKLDRRELGVLWAGRDDRCVEGAVAQAREQPVGQILHQIERRLRQRLGEPRQGDRQQVGRDGGDHAEAQFAGEGIARRVRGRAYAGRRGERRARLRHDDRRPVADASAAALAVKQAKAELRLELENLTAQRRLTDVARRRRAAEMAVVGDGDHIFEVPEVHSLKIGGANRLSRDNRLDLSLSLAYRGRTKRQ